MPIETYYYSTKILLLYTSMCTVLFHTSMLSVKWVYYCHLWTSYLNMLHVTVGYYYYYYYSGGLWVSFGDFKFAGLSVCNELQHLTKRINSYINNINSRCSICHFYRRRRSTMNIIPIVINSNKMHEMFEWFLIRRVQ